MLIHLADDRSWLQACFDLDVDYLFNSTIWPLGALLFLGLEKKLESYTRIEIRLNPSKVLLVANLSKWLNLIKIVFPKTLTKTLTKSLESDGLSQKLKVKNVILNPLVDIENPADFTPDAIRKP